MLRTSSFARGGPRALPPTQQAGHDVVRSAGRSTTGSLRSQTWTRRATVAVAGTLAALTGFGPGVAMAAPADRGPVGQYLVRAVPGQLASLDRDLRGDGNVVRQVRLIGADVVRLHATDAARLATDPRVASISRDTPVHLASARTRGGGATKTLAKVAREVGANRLWAKGVTGKGVDVALIDSGVAPVAALAGQVVLGPDLSFDSQNPSARYVDGYGHGTHLAGIIAGRDPATGFSGIAPDSRLVSVKVADVRGNADISQVIAGIDWVVQHAHSDGLNVRVLNLSFGTDSTQDYQIDPLAYAAEQAWHAGIVVVVSAGNTGTGASDDTADSSNTSSGLTNPAIDPYLLVVGAADTTRKTSKIAAFSARGNGRRNPDLVAPGSHLASLRDPDSTVDLEFGTTARVGNDLMRGSGTSQAAAVTSGAAALLLQDRPELSPDQVKALLTGAARSLSDTDTRAQGHGMLNVAAAAGEAATDTPQAFPRSTGTGSLELARGSVHLGSGDTQLRGEVDIMGQPVDTTELARLTAQHQAWDSGSFNGTPWTGTGLSSQAWASQAWASQAWASQAWASQAWASQAWASLTWG